MEQMDSVVSIFQSQFDSPELKMTMRDLASLAGVLKELGNEQMYNSPLEILRFLNIIQLLNQSALGIDDPIQDTEVLYYRYQRTYADPQAPDIKAMEKLITILHKNSWISKQTRQIKLQDRGKRLMDSLIRLANDSLAYYLQDDIGRSLFQARRDAELSEAYDDKGISGGNSLASMILNIEEAVDKLEARQLELLADRNALPQLELIHRLMLELEVKMQQRLDQFQTLEDSLVLRNLVQRATAVLTKGTALTYSLLSKYIRFITMQDTPVSTSISHDKIRSYLLKMYNATDAQIPDAHDIFSFMEHQKYEDEALDGIWLPVKFAAPLSRDNIDEAIHYLETYEPQLADEKIELTDVIFEEQVINDGSINDLFKQAAWEVTKTSIDTEKIETHLSVYGETELEELIIETSSPEWGDAIRSLHTVSAMLSTHQITVQETKQAIKYEKKWEWGQDDERKFTVKRAEHE